MVCRSTFTNISNKIDKKSIHKINTTMNKQQWLDLAEIIDAHRVIPKILVFSTVIGYMVLTWVLIDWGMDIFNKTGNIPTTISALIGTLLTTIAAIPTLVVRKYFEGGRNWGSSNADK